MNAEIKTLVKRIKEAQSRLQDLLKNQGWLDDARKYAEKQGKEVKKLLTADLAMVRTFLERERKELEKFQQQIPGEVQKLKEFIQSQRQELEKLIAGIRNGKSGAKVGKKVKKPASVKKRTAAPGAQCSKKPTASARTNPQTNA